MILIIDDQKINLLVWDFLLKKENIVYAQKLDNKHLGINWDFVFIDKNGDEDGLAVMDRLLLANPRLAGKIFIISESDYPLNNFIHKSNLIDYIKIIS